jgi:hypothetical protein
MGEELLPGSLDLLSGVSGIRDGGTTTAGDWGSFGSLLSVNDSWWSSLVGTVSVAVRRERADLDESELEAFLDRSQLGLHTLGPALRRVL